MTSIGFHASHEQFAPRHLLDCAQRAERVNFAAAMCSDHFHPWSERQGQSGFAWSWLGSALEATGLTWGTVCAPGQRYHPAIIAQASATLAAMYPGRFWIALGSGENLNEHITGGAWPTRPERDARLMECVEIIRALWEGETVSHQGRVQVDRAKLYTLPNNAPLLFGAALTCEAAQWIGRWADGLITVGGDAHSVRQVLDAFRMGGGIGKPVFVQAALSYAPTAEEAIHEAHHQWRHCVLAGSLFADLATVADFDEACRDATADEVRKRLFVSSDLKHHIDWLQQYIDLGVDAIYLHHVGRNLERFIDQFGDKVLPALQRPGKDARQNC